MTLLEVHDLTKAFPEPLAALSSVILQAAKQQFEITFRHGAEMRGGQKH